MLKVATVIGDGVHRDTVRWPNGVKFVHYKAREAAQLISSAQQGKLDVVVVHVHSVDSNVRKAIRDKVSIRFIEWPHGLHRLASELPTMLNVSPTPDLAPVRPFVRVVEASKHPERRPSWGEEERAALRAAYEDAVDFQRVIDGFLSLTSDLDVPVRSQAEIRAELARIRVPDAVTDEADETMTLLSWLCALVSLLARISDMTTVSTYTARMALASGEASRCALLASTAPVQDVDAAKASSAA